MRKLKNTAILFVGFTLCIWMNDTVAQSVRKITISPANPMVGDTITVTDSTAFGQSANILVFDTIIRLGNDFTVEVCLSNRGGAATPTIICTKKISLIGLEEGNYTVKYVAKNTYPFMGDRCDTISPLIYSDSMQVAFRVSRTTGIDTDNNSSLEIYTNGDWLYINEIPQPLLLEILSINGSVLKSQKIDAVTAQKVAINDLPSGIYVIRTSSARETYQKKIIKL